MIRLCKFGHAFVLTVIYRPGSCRPDEQFFAELENVVVSVLALNCRFVIMGNLNVHVDDSADRFTMWLNDIMSTYVLRQQVSGSTHRVGHTPDLVINAEDIAVQPVRLHDVGSLSDHKCLTFGLPSSDASVTKSGLLYTSRDWSTFDPVAFETELANSELVTTQTDDVDWLFTKYDNYLAQLLDQHAPKHYVRRKPRRLARWFDNECRQEKKKARHLEEVYRKTHLSLSRDNWQKALNSYRDLLRQKEEQYWNGRISHIRSYLWNSLNHPLHPGKVEPH